MGSLPDSDCLVVGAGIVGICTALALRQRGLSVVLIDRDEPAAGASSGNAGVLSPWSCVPQSMPGLWKSIPRWLIDPEGPVAVRPAYFPKLTPWLVRFFSAGRVSRLSAIADAMLALNRPTLDLYRELLKDTGAESLIQDGYYVCVSRDEKDLDLSNLGWRLRTERGVHLERIDQQTLQVIEPALSPEFPGAVLIHQQGRTVNPGRLGQVLAEQALAGGVVCRRAEALSLLPQENGSWQVGIRTVGNDATENSVIEGRAVILTAGVWSARLLKQLGVSVSMEAERGYHLTFTNPQAELSNAVTDIQAKVALNSMEMGMRCGGTAEFAGIDAAPDYRRATVFKHIASRVVPSLNIHDSTEWMGRRPSPPDSVPYIGSVPGYTGLYVGFGHAHLGLTGAPQTGRMLAALVAEDRQEESPNTILGVDLTPYRLDRFK